MDRRTRPHLGMDSTEPLAPNHTARHNHMPHHQSISTHHHGQHCSLYSLQPM
ncbi:unnamed protein product [Ectocarpus sp. 12 AP-2014]